MKKFFRYEEVTGAHIVYLALFVFVILWIIMGHMH
jgi:hypothetical protein